MKRILPALLCSATLVLASSCASVNNVPERPPLTLDHVVSQVKAGKDAQSIIEEIKTSQTVFDVTASQYAKLSRDGVPDAVLDFMQQGQLRMTERQGRRDALADTWLYGRGLGWGYGGIWSPRAYIVYINGKPYLREW